MAIELQNLGSLITYVNGQGVECCLGALLHVPEHGTFDASLGRVEVSKEHADTHNKLLDEAMLKGLENCAVGQWGSFYYNAGKAKVTTFTGTVVSTQIKRIGLRDVEFKLGNSTFRGRIRKDCDLVNFKRVR